jgi:phosphate transport system substrate-binding protein
LSSSIGVTRAALVSFLLLPACQPGRTIVRIDGSAGVAPLVTALANGYRQAHPADSIVIATGMGSSERLTAVSEGRIDIAMASHGVDEPAVRQRGMLAHTIARTAVVFAVNASVPITGITRRQVCEIFAGSIANWRQLDGPDMEIRAGTRPPDEVDSEVAAEHVACLADRPLGARVQVIARPDDMARAIATTAGAIGVTSGTMVEQAGGRMRALALDGVSPDIENVASETYAMARRSMLVTRNPPDAAIARFLGFIRSAEGAAIIGANGAVPVGDWRK